VLDRTEMRGRLFLTAMTLAMSASDAGAQSPVRIDGSTGAMPLVSGLAKVYEAGRSDVRFEIGKGLGTKARIDALNERKIDIAVASHGLDVPDLTARGLAVDEIARTPVVFAVNASVTVTNLTEAQVCSIYAGSVGDWKELGGAAQAVAALTRPDKEVDAEVVRDGIACLKALKMGPTVQVMNTGGDMARALASTVGAIGMTTTTVAGQSAGKVRALSLDGVTPTEANVQAGRYRLVREVFLVSTGTASPATKAFLAFVKSAEGAAAIKANGAIPRKAE
jgi:phosphate transport system substrate-binding protein